MDNEKLADRLEEYAPVVAKYGLVQPHSRASLAAILREAASALRSSGEAVAWPAGVLSREATIRLLTEHNAWRRGANTPQTDPVMLGKALDAAIAALESFVTKQTAAEQAALERA